ncbi:Transmembrane protein 45A [Lemmus lemmus]
MGSFKGHALPGTFFIIMGFWWLTKSILKYVYKKQTRTCYLSSKTLLRRAEIWEGIVAVLMAFTAFIFYNHTHGREMIDVFVHQLLVFTTILAGLVTFIEFLSKNNVLLELLRSSLVILQGTWFWQIGFVLYPLSGSPAWNLSDIENKMFLTMCFTWHYASTFVIIGLNYAFITW